MRCVFSFIQKANISLETYIADFLSDLIEQKFLYNYV